MSCHQASRFTTNNSSNLNINHNINHKNNNCRTLNSNNNRNSRGGAVVIQQEDPYVFTESVPTTPPILFNTQKTRTRLNDLTSSPITTTATLSIGKYQHQHQQKLPLTEANGKITSNLTKTQASFLSSSSLNTQTTTTTTSAATTNACIVSPSSKNNVIQSLTITNTTTTSNKSCNNNKKLANVCIVRPQLQQQQPPHYQHQHQNYINSSLSVYEGDIKSISPPPLYTPPTPSLWQTPLLLESTATTSGITTPQQNNVTFTAKPTATTITTPLMSCVLPTVQSVTVGLTTTTLSSTLTTTAMAKVAPIIVHTPLAPPLPQCTPATIQSPNQFLPPSKFHNHTLAQHLQKVECLKKSKKSIEADFNLYDNEDVKSLEPPLKQQTSSYQLTSSLTAASSIKTMDGAMLTAGPAKNSENEDLNEIPVNVIFRMAMVAQTNDKSSNNIQFVKPQTEMDMETTKQKTPPPLSSKTALASSFISPSPQLKTDLNKKLSIPASKTIKTTKQPQQQIHTSSIQQQKLNNATTLTALNSQPNDNETTNSKLSTNIENLLKTPTDNLTKVTATPTATPTATAIGTVTATTTLSIATNSKSKNSTHISTNKTSRKLNSLTSTNHTNHHHDLFNNWQLDCSTTTSKGSVAIVKMSQHNINLDTTHLATATGLPYCLQQYWFNSHDFHKFSSSLSSSSSSCEPLTRDKSTNRTLVREERIAVYKQQLRRQAMQLLTTRSLQKLPIQVAKRRLMCVDRLLRKYKQSEQNKKEPAANVKRCCINGCDANTLEMASHCQQHIVYNSAQHVFLPCTAKFADNTQCRVPVFDITHDLPLCMEHARKRDAYNRLLYEQRPRKISTNLMPINESTLTTQISNKKNPEGKGKATTTTTTTTATAVTGGMLVNALNYQQKQQQQQNILQQLPHIQHNNNSNNNNKRPTLVNQQTRKRKMTTTIDFSGNPVGRPQKRVKKSVEKTSTAGQGTLPISQQMPRLTTTNLKRKSSTTSLESIASNSQHSTTSNTSQQQQPQQYQRQDLFGATNTTNTSLIANTTTTTTISSLPPPPALAPLSGLVGHGLPQHLFSFGHDNHSQNQQQQQHYLHHQQQQQQHKKQIQPLNINDKHSYSSAVTSSSTTATTASTPTEFKDFIAQLSLLTQKQHTQADKSSSMLDVNVLNTNSNSNFTSSGMGSTTSLPTADDFLTQDMLSICENSSASSADTGLGGLSDPELMLGGPEDDIPLGDAHLLEEHDLENVLNSLPEDAFKELFTTVHQDESDEIERAIELADEHLKTLQQTIGSELGDFLDFNDDMLMDNGDLCNGSTANTILDTSALFIGSGGVGTVGIPTVNATQGGGSVIGTDLIRGLVQT